MEKLLNRIPNRTWKWLLLLGLGAFTIFCIALGIQRRLLLLYALPMIAVMGLVVIYNYKWVFLLMIAAIPISLQTSIGGGSAIDMFSEPLMLLFLLLFLFNLLSGQQFSLQEKIYPFHLLVGLLLFWTIFTTLFSEYPTRSWKFLASKVWYLAAFVYMGGKMIGELADIKRLFWAFFATFSLFVLYTFTKHALIGFSFKYAHGIASPIYANGVVYAATLCMFIPWAWFARTWYPRGSWAWTVIHIGLALFLLSAFFSYKRMAWLVLAALPIAAWLIRKKLFDKAVYAAIVVAFLGIVGLLSNNNYYYFAPEFGKTIWHEGDLSGHLSSTIEGTEISSVERFYRWVAAKNMVADMPILGSGPSTFNQVYKKYADDAFRTYVSGNEEESTTHNYFLMTFAEQGFVGGLFLLFFVLFMLLRGYYLYHQLSDPKQKNLLLMVMLSYLSILMFSVLNELLEVDKVGAMFWLNLLLIHKFHRWYEGAQAIST